jgi:hypothetical protein
MTNPQPSELAKKTRQGASWRLRGRTIAAVGVFLVAYCALAATLLPVWIVNLSAAGADVNTLLNAIVSTRAALLGVLMPAVVAFGGWAAYLNYRETTEHNRRTYGLAWEERDDSRIQRRAEVYVQFLSACERAIFVAQDVYSNRPKDPGMVGTAEYIRQLAVMVETNEAMESAAYRVVLLGAETVKPPVIALTNHVGKEIVPRATARPQLTDQEWTRIRVVEYGTFLRAVLDATERDLKPRRWSDVVDA